MPDMFTTKKRSEIMSKIRSSGTAIELKMKNALEENRIEFIYQPKEMFGHADFLVPPDLVIFCDSSFWHGRDWKKLRLKLKEGYWREHIGKTRIRDRKVDAELKKQGYIILRFWDRDIEKNMIKCINRIKRCRRKMRGIDCLSN
jgi:DNA mismatch endonuclease, patch repair protein